MILRAAFKVVMIVIVIFAVMAYLTYLRTGSYWLPSLPAFNFSAINDDPPRQSTVEISTHAYKWRENGRWVYGDQPPAGVDAIKLN